MDDKKSIKGKKSYLIIAVIAIAAIGGGIFYFQKYPVFTAKSSSHLSDETAAHRTNTANTSAANTLNSSYSSEAAVSQESKDSPKAVVYNTHPWEKCKSGDSIVQVSRKFADKLISTGIRSVFLNNSHSEVKDSYKTSRDLIENGVSNYKGKVLLDIMVDNIPNGKDILVYVAKGNPSYLKNADFAGRLVKEVNTLDKNISIAVEENSWVWNQDLSDDALTITIGSQVSNGEIEKGLETLSTALKNIENPEEQVKP